MQKELSKKRCLDILVMLPMIMKVLLMESFDGNDLLIFYSINNKKFDHSRSCTAADTASNGI
jgi:hypothetical protein